MRLKCARCGFVNFSHESTCKRCKSELGKEPEYHNAWRDGTRLVVGSGYLMPKRCLKCGTSDYVSREELELTYTPLSAYFTILLRFVHWNEISLHGFLCTSHRRFADRQAFLLLPNVLVVAGAGCMLLSLIDADPLFKAVLGFGGAFMLGAGVLFLKLTSDSFKVVKRNKKHIWIKGVDQDLLAQLEDYAVAKR